jgi:citrate lyase subunit beta/citryl-CoA lyase
MSVNLPLMRSHLYAPGNNTHLLEKVFSTEADAVILDLEDSVPLAEKPRARDLVRQALEAHAEQQRQVVFVRMNHPHSEFAKEDIRAIVRPGLSGLRVPKVENAATVHEVASWIEQSERAADMAVGSVAILCLIESATGVHRALDIAKSHPRVIGLAYGAVDLMRDMGITSGPDNLETLYIRSHLVLASRVVGVRPPVDTVWTRLDDPQALEKVTHQGRALGFFGKSAIHPNQLDVINAVYTPSAKDIKHAQALIEQAEKVEQSGSAAFQSNGELVDTAVIRRARDVIHLAERLGVANGPANANNE